MGLLTCCLQDKFFFVDFGLFREFAIHSLTETWAQRNGCDPTPTITFTRGEVKGETWGNGRKGHGCRENALVTLYTIEGRGHSWPDSDMPAEISTQDIDATRMIWEFFQAHPMP